MKVLITGVAGLIGSHIAELCLDRGYEIVGVDNLFRGTKDNMSVFINHERFCFYNINMRNVGTLDFIPDVIFHMGAVVPTQYFYEGTRETFINNVVCGSEVLWFAEKHQVKAFINGSSSEIYGHQEEFPTTENARITYDNPLDSQRWSYATGKLMIEYLANQLKINPIHMRFGNVYGERDVGEEHVIPRFIAQALRGEDLIVDSIPTKRTFVHVEDCAQASMLAMDNGLYYSAYNIGGTEDITITQLADEIIRLTESKSQVASGIDRPGNPRRRVLDTTRARIELGWKPLTSLKRGLEGMVDYIKGYDGDY